jgi:S-formylglutathione hydrolase
MRNTLSRLLRLALHTLSLIALGACAASAPKSPLPANTQGLVVHDWVHGKGLEGNPLGDSPDRSVHVYLPPSYLTHPDRRYPVVYLLHGFGGTSNGDLGWLAPGSEPGPPSPAAAMDAGVASGQLHEMIIVMPDCTNAYGGSFYVNSVVAGGWEDFVVRDLVAFIDQKFRTLNDPSARAIVGHSMGGFGALRIAFAHPDVFSVVFAISPAAIDDMLVAQIRPQEFVDAATAKTADELAGREFFQRAAVAAGAALSPNPNAKPLLVDLPFVAGPSGPQRVDAVARSWSTMLASSSIASHRATIARLRAIGLEVGDHDEVKAIITTTHAMDRALTAANLPHDFHEFHGGHVDHLSEQIAKTALPFASAHLAFAAAPSAP